jgi:hypothetical protein
LETTVDENIIVLVNRKENIFAICILCNSKSDAILQYTNPNHQIFLEDKHLLLGRMYI